MFLDVILDPQHKDQAQPLYEQMSQIQVSLLAIAEDVRSLAQEDQQDSHSVLLLRYSKVKLISFRVSIISSRGLRRKLGMWAEYLYQYSEK